MSVKGMSARLCDVLATEINKPETQAMLRAKVIHPLVGMIYAELYPYIMAVILSILCIFVLSLLTVVLLYFSRRAAAAAT